MISRLEKPSKNDLPPHTLCSHHLYISLFFLQVLLFFSKLCIMQILLRSIKPQTSMWLGTWHNRWIWARLLHCLLTRFPSPWTTALRHSTEAIYNKNRLGQIQWNPTSKFRESGELERQVTGWFDRCGLLVFSAQALKNKTRLPVCEVELIKGKRVISFK